MAMRTNSAPEAGISAVLSTYANFYPDLLFPELLGGGGAGSSAIAGGSAAGLKYPDSDWIASVLLAHARCARRRDGETVESDDEAETDAEAGGRAAKKQRLSSKAVRDGADGDEAAITSAAPTSIPIPNLVTIQPLNSAQKAFGTHPSLITELSSLRHLAHSLDRLVLPSQAAAMLGSGFGSRLMRVAVLAGATITNEDSLSQTIPAGRRNRQAEQDLCWARLSDWLESVLSDELGVQTRSTQRQQLKLPATEAEFKRLAALLRRTRYVFELAEQMPVRLEDLTSTVLLAIAQVAEADSTQAHDPAVDAKNVWSERWDQLAREVLPFVPLVTPSDLASFEERFLAPLEVLATSSKVSLDTSAAVLLALSGMLDNWGSRDWSNIGKTLDARHSYRWGIANLDAAIDYTELISSVSARTDALATSLIGLYPRHVLIEHAVLSVYEMLSGPLAGMRASATIPALPLFAFTLHATTLVPVSRLCGLVQDLRSAFEDHNAGTHPAPTIDGGLESKVYDLRSTFFEEENLATLNSNVTLVANLVWLGKLVTGTDVVGGLPAGIDEAVLADLTQRGDDLNLKLATLANTPFSRAMSHISERFANVYCSQRDAESAEHDGGIRGPVTVKTLKAAKKNGIPAGWTHTDFRAYMLDWLDREGAHGMYELLKNILVTFGNAPTASAQSKSLKVKLTKPKSRDATPHEESATSTPASSGKKVTLKANGKKRSVADLRELGDESDDEEAAQSGDDFVPEQGPVDKKYGKRDRQTRNKARATIADDEEEEEPVKVPQRKRAKLEDSKPDDGGKRKARSGKGARRTVDYSSDEDEAMVDAASDEDDDLPNAAATGTDDEFEEDVGPAAGKKRKSDSGKKAAPRAGPSAKSTAGPGGKKAATSASAATASTAGANKAMSSEARMRASIDAALDKKAPSAAPTKLNPQASAFRPGGALKPGAPAGGASTPTGAGKPTSTTSTVKRPSGKPAFGKSMSGWDSLFGPLSGLSSPTASGSAKPTPPKAAPPVSATGIRPDPVLEAASAADVQRLKGEAVEEHLNTDECFDLLAHADIMLAFERGLYVEDRKLASRLRPFVWRAGGVIHGKQT
uniref:Uncharacterized protein n=1 Tax=Kalmanozyma brasiliensis (strain GHG001) TaxID=1365824 RepID=V5EZZ0_KALBG